MVSVSRFPFPVSRLFLAAAILPVLPACEFDEKTIGVGERSIAVHAVLDPIPPTGVVLVEDVLTGRVPIVERTPDVDDPIVSGGGIPISNARVVITASSGDSAVLVEDITVRTDNKGAGVYRYRNASKSANNEPDRIRVIPGESYSLRVETSEGTVIGTTTVPNTTPTFVNTTPIIFNRDQDSVFLNWSDAPLAHRYAIRVESPRGPLVVFVDSLEYLVAGTLRNFYTEGLPATFVPGFRQAVSVGAVDINYYDYFRSLNNPLTGRGLINHLQGGIGVFGSYVMMRGQILHVIAERDQPIEAPYNRFAGPPNAPISITIYLESGSSSGIRQVSGNWTPAFGLPPRGLIGTIDTRAELTLAMLADQFVTDTVDVLELRWDGLALLGSLRSSGARVDYRRAAP